MTRAPFLPSLVLLACLLGACSNEDQTARIAALEARVEELADQVVAMGGATVEDIDSVQNYGAVQARHVHVGVNIQSFACSLPDAYASRVLVQQTGLQTCNVRALRLTPQREDYSCPADFDVIIQYFDPDKEASRVEIRGAEEENGVLISNGGPQFECGDVEQVRSVWIAPPGFEAPE